MSTIERPVANEYPSAKLEQEWYDEWEEGATNDGYEISLESFMIYKACDWQRDRYKALAAACYAEPRYRFHDEPPLDWPCVGWHSRHRDLVKAGALILAEIERIDRQAALTTKPAPKGG